VGLAPAGRAAESRRRLPAVGVFFGGAAAGGGKQAAGWRGSNRHLLRTRF